MSRTLDVYLHENFAGQLTQDKSGRLSFVYNLTYLSQRNFALSISLPLQPEPFMHNRVKAFFSGILPDSVARIKLAKHLGVSEKNPFSLLEVIGGECVGALALYPEGEISPKPTDDDIKVIK